MNISESLTRSASLFPERTALVHRNRQISYRELDLLSRKATSILQEEKIQAGDRVALMLPNAPSFPIWYYAVLRLGAIAVSVSTRLAADEVEFILSDCDAAACIIDATQKERLTSVTNKISKCWSVHDDDGRLLVGMGWDPLETGFDQKDYQAKKDEAALILYTSGTTGFPKGATLSHGNVLSNVQAFNQLCQMSAEDRVLLTVPLFHCFGQNAILNSVLNVAGAIVMQERFDLGESIRLITSEQITQLYGVPMMFRMLLDACAPDDLPFVHYCFSAAAPLPLPLSESWHEKFSMPIFEGYGLTETSPFASYNHSVKYRPGSIGTAIDGVEIRVVDEKTGEPCDAGEVGEITIRGPNVMLGYWNRPQETEAVIRNGWFHSGDLGCLDKEGYLFILDRMKDMISVGGLKVFPAEVERVLLDHPSVIEAAVVGRPDPIAGEEVVGFLVLASEDASEASIRDVEHFAASHLADFKVPRRLIKTDHLPRNPSGKILKNRLREWAHQDRAEKKEQAASRLEQPDSLYHQLKRSHPSDRGRVASKFIRSLVRDVGKLETQPSSEDSFSLTGLDSLSLVELAGRLQEELGERETVTATILFDYPTIHDLAMYLVNVLDDPIPVEKGVASDVDADSLTLSLRSQIESLTEAEALVELLKELD